MKDFYNNFFINKSNNLDNIEVLSGKLSFDYIKNYTYSLSTHLKNEFLNEKYYTFNIFFKKHIYSKYHECLIIAYIDVDKIYELIQNGKDIPNRNLLFQIIYIDNFYKKNNIKINDNFLDNIQIDNTIDITMWDNLNFSKYFNNVFYNYQKKNILWMINNECNRHTYFRYFSKNILHFHKDCYFDILLNRFYFKNQCNKIKLNGGLLFDEPGLGKSLCSIALCELNKEIEFSSPFKYKSNATLILTSNEMCSHWKYLINYFVKKKRKVILLINKRDFDKYTYQDLIDSEYVIFSINLFINKCFYDKIKKYEFNNSINEHIEDIIKTIILEKERNVNLLSEKNPFPFIIYWKRIIYDKVIERSNELNYNIIYDFLKNIKSFHKWILEDKINSNNIIKFIFPLISNENIDLNIKYDYNYLKLINEINFNKIFRKNLKNDIHKELIFKKNNKKFININFNDSEQIIFNNNPKIFNNIVNCEWFNYFEFISKNYKEITFNKLKEIINNDSYFQELENIINNKIECSICYDELLIDNFLFYKCGHYNCYNCIKKIKKCPTCRININNNVYKVNYNNQKILNQKIIELNNFINNNNNTKNIILSYNECIFDKIKKNLNINNNIYICKGSYIQKNFIINNFNNEKNSILFCNYNSCELLHKINLENVNIIYYSPLNISNEYYKHIFNHLNNILSNKNLNEYYFYYSNSIENVFIDKIKNIL